GATVDVTDRVEIRVKNSRVAVVEGTTLRAIAPGESDVIAEEPMTRKRSRTPAKLHVPRLVSLAIAPATTSIAVGATAELRALARFDDGSRDVDVTGRVHWPSSKPGVLHVDDGTGKGTITGLAAGSAEVRVEDPISQRRSDRSTGRVVVGGAASTPTSEVLALRFEPEELSLTPGEKRTFTVFAVLADGTEQAL